MSRHGRKISKVCGCCHRPMKRAQAVHDGIAYCPACYKREFRPVPCESCGETTRTPGGKTPALCKKCRSAGRSCARCGKDTPHAALILEDGRVACASCAKYFREPKACPVCGQYSIRLSRDFKAGFTEPVCPSCRRKGYITCPCCGKHRRPEGVTSDGKVVCKDCLKMDGKPWVCPKCGKEGRRHSKTRCEDCYWRESVEDRLRDAMALINRDWVRESFSKFMVELADRIGAKTAALRLEKYFLFFAVLDASFDYPDAVTPDTLTKAFGTEGLRRHAVPYGFLTGAGVLPETSEEALEAASERRAQERIMARAEGTWYLSLLGDFRLFLRLVSERYERRGWKGKRRRFGERTITSALRSAERFLASMGSSVTSVQQIDQPMLDSFIMQSPGYRNGVRAFVRYLNRYKKLFRKIKVETVSRNFPEGMFLDHKRHAELLGKWLNPDDGTLKESLICVLILLYAQKVKNVVRLKVSDLLHGRDGVYRVAFGKTEISLARSVCKLLDRWLVARRALSAVDDERENEYLFPGRTRGGHLTEAAVTYYLNKHGVTAETLFATAIYQAYLNGLKHPKALSRAFGITDFTAIKYLDLINPRLRDEAEKVVSNG